MTTHFTAWLVNDPSCLDGPTCDITILEDELLGDDSAGGGWATDSSKEPAFYALTQVDAENGDIDDAIREAEALMGEAGWRTVADWDAVDNAYVVTVERV
ncbi:hypothetical protein ACF06X_33710 [Streptomyces sp. NPDC015346]|uniref:hypothetical protein n=1 Tax=Streptomyces sp. NPDC015346 TaxID=3364954 RepID=UPI0036F834B9